MMNNVLLKYRYQCKEYLNYDDHKSIRPSSFEHGDHYQSVYFVCLSLNFGLTYLDNLEEMAVGF